ncbi:hypothetical protein [Kribbella solani]|uniref:Cation transport ATPase n=1 Tax=Kribbella solani TaxID=236067 RepID=A0A841DZ34_9ACTN|nr:hypothetical protein [Kribbella solani]MBB5982030.1 cation transport ATPase [Kribbella solani]
MAQSDSEPEPAPAAEPVPATAPTPHTSKTPDAAKAPSSDKASDSGEATDAEKAPDVDKARRTVTKFLWSCGWLTLLVGVFLLSEIIQSDGKYNGLAWLGSVVAMLSVLAVAAAYVACALDRIALRTRLFGRFDLFQLITVVMLLAVVTGVLIPTEHTTALALLLPWGLSYWLHNLKTPPTP